MSRKFIAFPYAGHRITGLSYTVSTVRQDSEFSKIKLNSENHMKGLFYCDTIVFHHIATIALTFWKSKYGSKVLYDAFIICYNYWEGHCDTGVPSPPSPRTPQLRQRKEQSRYQRSIYILNRCIDTNTKNNGHHLGIQYFLEWPWLPGNLAY